MNTTSKCHSNRWARQVSLRKKPIALQNIRYMLEFVAIFGINVSQTSTRSLPRVCPRYAPLTTNDDGSWKSFTPTPAPTEHHRYLSSHVHSSPILYALDMTPHARILLSV